MCLVSVPSGGWGPLAGSGVPGGCVGCQEAAVSRASSLLSACAWVSSGIDPEHVRPPEAVSQRGRPLLPHHQRGTGGGPPDATQGFVSRAETPEPSFFSPPGSWVALICALPPGSSRLLRQTLPFGREWGRPKTWGLLSGQGIPVHSLGWGGGSSGPEGGPASGVRLPASSLGSATSGPR